MQYYRINVYRREDPDYCFIEQAPEEILYLSASIQDGEPALSEYPDSVVAKMDPAKKGIFLSDFISNNELSLICSGRVKSIIEKLCGDTCEYLPVSIENHKGRIASTDYFYINPLGHYDCLHQSQSKIVREDGQVIRVDLFVLDKKKIEGLPPLFRVPENPSRYFTSQVLVDALQKGIPDLTNFNLEPIDVAD